MEITLLYASLLGVILIALSWKVVKLRRKHQVGIGGGEVPALKRAIRAQANFTEYVPLAVLLLALIELSQGVPGWLLHVLGAMLVIGRVLHGIGLGRSAGASTERIVGTLATWIVLAVGAVTGLWVSVF